MSHQSLDDITTRTEQMLEEANKLEAQAAECQRQRLDLINKTPNSETLRNAIAVAHRNKDQKTSPQLEEQRSIVKKKAEEAQKIANMLETNRWREYRERQLSKTDRSLKATADKQKVNNDRFADAIAPMVADLAEEGLQLAFTPSDQQQGE